MRNSWEDFKRLSTLSLGFSESLAKKAVIFGNGKNQIEILVTLSMQGTDNQPLKISKEELERAVYLCDYRTGEKLSKPWDYKLIDNGFNRAVSYQDVAGIDPDTASVEEQAGKLSIKLYVSSETIVKNSIIAVGIHVPEVGDFDTTEDGTGIPNGPKGASGAPFKSPKYLNIAALPPIDYSKVENLEVHVDEFRVIETQQRVEWRSKSNNNSYKGEKIASVKKRTIEIGPKTDVPDNKFLTHAIIGRAIKSSDVNTGETSWHGKMGPSFTAIQDDTNFDKPGTVIGRGASYDTYELNFCFSGEKNPCINGFYYVEDSNYEYRCDTATVTEPPAFDPKSGKARMILLKSVIACKNCNQKGWRDVKRRFDVHLTDIYGNDGITMLHFDNGNYFDIPHIGS